MDLVFWREGNCLIASSEGRGKGRGKLVGVECVATGRQH